MILNQFGNADAIRKFVLNDEIGMHTPPLVPALQVGIEAIAITDLRPSGKIEHNSVVYDATTTGGWITEGAKVRIMQSGMTVEVEELET